MYIYIYLHFASVDSVLILKFIEAKLSTVANKITEKQKLKIKSKNDNAALNIFFKINSFSTKFY